MLSSGPRVIPISLLSLAVGLVGFGALLLTQFPPDYSGDAPQVEVLSETETVAATDAPTTSASAQTTTSAPTTSTEAPQDAPADAATTSTTMSVTWAPRARMSVNAAWPGVSRKVTVRSFHLTWYAPMC